jgi:ABC-type multidrug transport system ATPase subunit
MINTPPQVLAGVLPSARNQVLRGELGGECCSNGERDAAAFVGQDDRFYSHLSVRETLLVAAKLRLPRLGGAESQDVIDELLRQLHLSHVR